MRRKFQHDALFILLICSWIPVAIAGTLILMQMRFYLGQIEQSHVQRIDQAKIALNSQLLGVEAIAEILLATRELNDFIWAGKAAQPLADNLLYGRISFLKKRAPHILSFTILNKESNEIFSFPSSNRKNNFYIRSDAYGFSLIDQNTLRYYRPIAYDDNEFPGPNAKLKGFLILDINLLLWRKSLVDSVTIKKIPKQPSVSGIDLDIANTDQGMSWQYLPYLLILFVVLVMTTIVGLYLTRSRIVKPITGLTHYVRQQMGGAPDCTPQHELAVLKESFETYVRYESELKAKLLQQSTLAAIGRTTQMLAHDVRKPFSMLKGLLHLTRVAKDPADTGALVEKFIPEIDKAMVSVEGLIRDIMEVGSNKKPNQEAVHLSSLIQTTLYDVFRSHAGGDIKFRYAFNHRHALYVDPLKASRMFTNITSNAIEAAGDKGEMWFESREQDNQSPSMIEIVIGNSGSFIPEDRRERVFDAFFTEGKRGGTGLGLAIVKKLVADHGGEISCRSSKAIGTEFVFTLPAADLLSEGLAQGLPASSSEIIKALQDTRSAHAEPSSELANEARLVDRIVDTARQTGERVVILVADDEPLYRRMLESHLEDSRLKPHIHLVFADTAERALDVSADGRFDVVIMDVNFGNEALDGIEAVRRLRAAGSRANICIHSNHGPWEYQRKAMDAGANLFMLKPMTRFNVLMLVYSTISEQVLSAPGLKQVM